MPETDYKTVMHNCKNCTERHAGCHSGCVSYKAFREAREKVYKDRKAMCDASISFKPKKYKKYGLKREAAE